MAGLVASALVGISAAHAQTSTFADQEKLNPELMVLVSKLASASAGASEEWKASLVQSYEAVYGKISDVPAAWPALVRRALTCHAAGNPDCVRTSLQAIEKAGGPSRLPLTRLLEVSRFKLTPADIETRLATAAAAVAPAPPAPAPAPAQAAPEPAVASVPAPTPEYRPAESVTGAPAVAPAVTVPPVAPTVAPAPARPVEVLPTSAVQSNESLFYPSAAVWVLAVAGSLYYFLRMRKKRPAPDAATNDPAIDEQETEAAQAAALAPTPVPEPEVDPGLAAARRLLDALHKAESDVAPFLSLMGEQLHDTSLASHVETVQHWHQAIVEGRNSVMEKFQKHGWPIELVANKPALVMGEATERLWNHASFFSSLLLLQGKQDSAIFHWARQLPTAVMHLYWKRQTTTQLEVLQEDPNGMPLLECSRAPVTLADANAKPEDFFENAVRQANAHAT